jgi:hypothetical protein
MILFFIYFIKKVILTRIFLNFVQLIFIWHLSVMTLVISFGKPICNMKESHKTYKISNVVIKRITYDNKFVISGPTIFTQPPGTDRKLSGTFNL